MKNNILGERIWELIGDSNVIAALFYTFNFEPEFFENYVMPILVSRDDFTDNKLQNAILWRRFGGEGKIPKTAIYFDEKMKRMDQSPELDYKTVGVRLKGANFHPKTTFILTDDERLIIFIGSNNLSAAGWNTNIEIVTELVIDAKNYYPKGLVNSLSSFISQASEKGSRTIEENDAETLILNFLSKTQFKGITVPFYYSFDQKNNFENFISAEIKDKESVKRIEIISPFFSSDLNLVNSLHTAFRNAEICCLTPNNKDNYIEIEEELFKTYRGNNVKWCLWRNPIEKDRRVHAKIYRFYSNDRVITILGSVNFTEQAWNTNNKGNIECAVLYSENDDRHLLKEYSFDDYRFVGEQENQEKDEEIFKIDYPDISFVIDWKTDELKWDNRSDFNLTLHKPDEETIQIQAKQTYYTGLSKKVLKKYADNSIIKIQKGEDFYYYYPQHENIEYKPLSSRYRFSETEILNIWNSLSLDEDNSKKLQEKLARFLEKLSDDDGEIDKKQLVEHESVLNKMGINLSALVNLERFLFTENQNFENIKYYLTTENFDSIPYYLNDLQTKFDDKESNEKMIPGFYWLLLSVINKNFYKNRKLITKDGQTGDDISVKINEYKNVLDERLKELERSKNLNEIKDIITWAKKNI